MKLKLDNFLALHYPLWPYVPMLFKKVGILLVKSGVNESLEFIVYYVNSVV